MANGNCVVTTTSTTSFLLPELGNIRLLLKYSSIRTSVEHPFIERKSIAYQMNFYLYISWHFFVLSCFSSVYLHTFKKEFTMSGTKKSNRKISIPSENFELEGFPIFTLNVHQSMKLTSDPFQIFQNSFLKCVGLLLCKNS